MAQTVDFPGANCVLENSDKLRYQDMPAFDNGQAIVTCWELSYDDIVDIVRQQEAGINPRLFICIKTPSGTSPALCMGHEKFVREMTTDLGKVWKNG